MGNWELLSVTAGMAGYPVNVLYRPLDFIPLDEFFIRFRTRFGARVIPSRRAMRDVLKCLGRGEVAAMLMDQNVDWREGVFVEFFGRRACTNKGLAPLALKTGAPVVPVFMIRERDGFTVEYLPEIRLIKTGDKTRDVEENTRQYNKVIEAYIRQYPEQWLWLHQRWKTRPYQPWPRNLLLRKESKAAKLRRKKKMEIKRKRQRHIMHRYDMKK
jgi:KDO2-lipid IV(A) lauroyltransferase